MSKINTAYLSQINFNKYNNFDPDTAYSNLLNQMEKNNPVLMDFDGHSDLALALTTFKERDESYIFLYENNFPDSDYTAVVNLKDKTFFYSYSDSSGYKRFSHFSTVPSSVFSGIDIDTVINHFIIDLSEKLTKNGQKFFTISGPANLMLENSSGNKAGYDSVGILHNEIMDAEIIKSSAGDSSEGSLTGVYIPSNQNYTEKIYSSGNGYLNIENYSLQDSGNLFISYADSIYITTATICTLTDNNPVQTLKIDWNGDGIIDSTVNLKCNIVTSVKENKNKYNIPDAFNLSQNYPNPFNPSTTISYSVPKTSFVTIKVYDVLGKEITTLVNADKQSGNYNVKFDGSRLASGIYFYRMEAVDFVCTKKLILLK